MLTLPKALRRLRVGIVGCGTAGPATALTLLQQGHEVTIFDRTAKLQPVGAGIGIQPIGMTMLHNMGLLPPILDHAARIDKLYGITTTGRPVLDLSYKDLHPSLFGLGLHRGVLFGELLRAMEGREGPDGQKTDIVAGTEIKSLERKHDDTVTLHDADGATHGPYDLVVVADGAHSELRASLGWKSHFKPYPFGCLWAILPDEDHTFSSSHTLSQVYNGTETMLGFLPTGHMYNLDGTEAATPTVSLFWSLPTEGEGMVRQQPIEQWKEGILKLEPRAEGLLKHVQSHSDLQMATYADVSMGTFGNAPIVAIGDCAHAMSPQLGQGANVALVDAWKLGQALGSACGQEGGSTFDAVQSGLRQYNKQRRLRTWFYQANSRMLTPVFQSKGKAVGMLRDMVMGPLCRFPPTRRQMLATMTGALHPNWISLLPDEEYMAFLDDDYFKEHPDYSSRQ